MDMKIQWVINPNRRDKRTGALKSIRKSSYAQYLFNKGAGWNE